MPDPAERFLAAATAPLGDNAELQIMARRELEEGLAAGNEAELAEATAALEGAKPRRRWRIALYVVMALVSVVSLGGLGRMAESFDVIRMILDPFSGEIPDSAESEARLGKNLSAQERLLLFGDTTKTSPAERFKALWDSDPGNPAYFAEYSLHFIQEHDRLPPDFLDTAGKLDPDNAWFTVVAASVTAKDAVERGKQSLAQRKQALPPDYVILDPKRLDEAIRLLEKAAGQPRFHTYQASLLSERLKLISRRTDFASQLPGVVHLAMSPSVSFHFRHAAEAADAGAWQAADQGDAVALRHIAAIWEPCLRGILRDPSPDMIHGLLARAALSGAANRYATTSLPGIEDLNERWRPIAERMRAEKEERDTREWNEELRLKAGMFAGLSLPVLSKQLQSPIPLTDADLKPGRMVDHELFSRVAAAALCLVFGLMLLAAALYRQRASVLVKRLSRRLEDLLRPADWAWILGGGVGLPMLFYLVIYRLTPLGARDWSLAASAFIVPAGQAAAMGLLMIVLPVLIARWRLGKRGAALGWYKGRAWMGWTAVACGALSLPVFGLSFASGKGSEVVMMVASALLGILALAWLLLGLRAVFSKRPALLRRVTLSRVLVPAYAFGMLLMAASMPLYHAAEKRWLAQDRLMEITPEAPALSRYEWQVAQALRAENLELLESK
jgi:hypothetical protein